MHPLVVCSFTYFCVRFGLAAVAAKARASFYQTAARACDKAGACRWSAYCCTVVRSRRQPLRLKVTATTVHSKYAFLLQLGLNSSVGREDALLISYSCLGVSVPSKNNFHRANLCFTAHAIAQPGRHTDSEAFQSLQLTRAIYDIKFWMLLVRENESSLRKWSRGTAHLRGNTLGVSTVYQNLDFKGSHYFWIQLC